MTHLTWQHIKICVLIRHRIREILVEIQHFRHEYSSIVCKIRKKRNQDASITCSYIWHVNISKYLFLIRHKFSEGLVKSYLAITSKLSMFQNTYIEGLFINYTEKNNFNNSIVLTNCGENNVCIVGFLPIVVNNSRL